MKFFQYATKLNYLGTTVRYQIKVICTIKLRGVQNGEMLLTIQFRMFYPPVYIKI
jgi:hypothetical protein